MSILKHSAPQNQAAQRSNLKYLRALGLIGVGIILGLPFLIQQAEAQNINLHPTTQTKINQIPGSIRLPSEAQQQPQPSLIPFQQEPVAYVMPRRGQASIQLINNTQTSVYVELTNRNPYLIPAGEQVEFPQVSLPVTVTAWRDDNGFLVMLPMTAPQRSGLLAVTLDAAANPVENNQGVLRIQSDGQVFLN